MNLRKIIKEELDNLDWIKNTNPYQNPVVGDIIEVHNMGDEKEYLDWLGSHKQPYQEGEFGDVITGEVIYMESVEMKKGILKKRILLEEQNTGLNIIFPSYKEMENRVGFKLLYIIK